MVDGGKPVEVLDAHVLAREQLVVRLVRRELEQELALAHQPLPRFAAEVSSSMLVATLLERTSMLSLVSRQTAGYLQRSGSIRVLPLVSQRRSHVGVMWRKDQELGELERSLLAALRQASDAVA